MPTLRQRIAALLPKGAFNRAAAMLVGGTAIGQVVTIVASPLLTRLYAPGDFGTLAVYTSVITIIGGQASFSYHQAIPIPETDGEAANLLGVSMLTTVATALFSGVAMALCGQWMAIRLGAPGLGPWLWMVPLGVFALSAHEVAQQWAVRKKAFRVIASTTVIRGFAQIGTQLGLGLVGVAPFGLLLGQLVGQWSGSGTLLRLAWKEDEAAIRALTARSLQDSAVRHQDFPRYSAPAVLLSAIGTEAPALLLSFFFGNSVTGLYALGMRVLSMPVSLVARSAGQVFFASAAEALRAGRLAEETATLYGRMVRMAAPFTVLLVLAAPDLFAVVFGEKWREAGVYTQWMVPWIGVVFLAYPLMALVSVCDRQRSGMVWQVALLVGRVSGLAIGGMNDNARLAIALFGLGSGSLWAAYTLWLLRLAGVRLGVAGRMSIRPVIESVAFSLPIIAAKVLGASSWVVLAAFSVSSAMALARLIQTERSGQIYQK